MLINTLAPCLFVVQLAMNSCAFSSRTCSQYLEKAREENYDIIVVPGVPFENGQWSYTMKGRVFWSKYMYDNGITKNIMYSGGAVYTPYVEAEIMALYAEKLGIKKENIYTEALAEHSTENIYYGYRKSRKLGFERIALATDAFQAKMRPGARSLASSHTNDPNGWLAGWLIMPEPAPANLSEDVSYLKTGPPQMQAFHNEPPEKLG